MAAGSLLALPVRARNAEPATDCRLCHLLAAPAPGDAALLPCPRVSGEETLRRTRGPAGVVQLDMLSNLEEVENRDDLYGPVPFDHGAHADWAEVAGGCGICHHRSPQLEHPACRSCHAAGFQSQDPAMPGLKGAYHRQCLGCHREWSHTVGCGTCHLPRSATSDSASKPVASTARDDIVGTLHPPIQPEESYRFESSYPSPTGSRVLFHHQRHVGSYGLRCAECHRGDSCRGCHDELAGGSEPRRMGSHGSHDTCGLCHDTESGEGEGCELCHRPPELGPPAPFDHAQTGWPLEPRHEGLSCRACHGDAPYRRRARECDACHDDWVTGTVAHERIAGVRLDEIHRELACEDCHPGTRFALPPVCDGCHSEGVAPDLLPGRRVSTLGAKAAQATGSSSTKGRRSP